MPGAYESSGRSYCPEPCNLRPGTRIRSQTVMEEHRYDRSKAREAEEVIVTTLLDLVVAVSDSTSDDREVVTVVDALLRSGRVQLIGQFRAVDLNETHAA